MGMNAAWCRLCHSFSSSTRSLYHRRFATDMAFDSSQSTQNHEDFEELNAKLLACGAGAEASPQLSAIDVKRQLRAEGYSAGMQGEASSHACNMASMAFVEIRSCGLRMVLIIPLLYIFFAHPFLLPFL